MQDELHYDIFLDGTCSFCLWTKQKIEPFDAGHRLRFLDFNDPAVAAQASISRASLRDQMHVRTPEGVWLQGFAAWVAIAGVLPRWAWLARIASHAPIRWIGPALYKMVAQHRHLIPGAPIPCSQGACAIPEHHHR